MPGRRRPRAGLSVGVAAVSALFITGSSAAPAASPQQESGILQNAGAVRHTQAGGRLAVVVPVYEGDLEKSFSSMALWPKVCSQETLAMMDLVMYKAEGENEQSRNSLPIALEDTAGRCFANTKVVYANLADEDNVYPKGPSMQFYKLFLDNEVRQHFTEYDAFAIIEWDVLVARETSFQQLYHATFDVSEPFWVKGSVLAGTNFHNVAVNSELWHVLGHINGNAIYNNHDPDFVEFVEYTLARWEYQYPYDVALWATISDFPYSWPLWQRYSTKFVTTNLIANVGYENVDVNALNAAVSGDTLFIHGSRVEGGSGNMDTSDIVPAVESIAPCEDSCSSSDDLPSGVSMVCDVTCDLHGRFGGHLCGAGDSAKYGSSCRLCYTDQVAALAAEAELRNTGSVDVVGKHVIMCDTKRPPAALECDSKCNLKADTICDHTCGTGRYGDYHCSWRNHGTTCRYCFHDLQAALVADEVAQRHGGRVVMCDTHEPPQPTVNVDTVERVTAAMRQLSSKGKKSDKPKWRKKKNWEKKQKWRDMAKWREGKHDDDYETIEKELPSNPTTPEPSGCEASCVRDGDDIGRICDPSCSEDSPVFGKRGCGTRSGRHGPNCRKCYYNLEKARQHQDDGEPVVMCDTVSPASVYTVRNRRRLTSTDASRALTSKGKHKKEDEIPKWRETEKWKKDQKWRDTAKWRNGGHVTERKGKHGDDDETIEKDLPSKPATPELSGCEATCHANGDNTGRICDPSCSEDNPVYGKRGCGTRNGRYGPNCRTCYFNFEMAHERQANGRPVVMCDTLSPSTVYGPVRRRLTSSSKSSKSKKNKDHKGSGGWQKKDKKKKKKKKSDWPNKNKKGSGDSSSDDGSSKNKNGKWSRTDWGNADDDDLKKNGWPKKDEKGWDDSTSDDDDDRFFGWPQKGGHDSDNDDSSSDDDDDYSYRDDGLSSDNDDGPLKKNKRGKKKGNEPSMTPSEPVDPSGCKSSCPVALAATGRVCDPTCSEEYPIFGKSGCGVGESLYGPNCRVCYFDLEVARELQGEGEEVIMCDSLTPATAYADLGHRRRLTTVAVVEQPEVETVDSWVHEFFAPGIEQGNLCAFMGSTAGLLEETEVTVRSVMEFMPGVRVALAVVEEDLVSFEEAFEGASWVSVSATSDPRLSALFADQYCGGDTELIYYLTPGTLLSRSFSSKDTHSPRGDLLVVYSEGRGADRATLGSARATSALLGFEAPVFTYGTDLILPSYVNGELATAIGADAGDDREEGVLAVAAEFENINAEEVLAAFAYSRNFEGIWFLNPQKWVTQHLFKAASIWDIPLVKPRFSCSLDPSLDLEMLDLEDELSEQLGSLIGGATCESGYLNLDSVSLR